MAKKVGNTYFFTGKGKSSGGGGGGGDATDAIKYTEQTLNESQQMQARKNQGLYYEEEGIGDKTITLGNDVYPPDDWKEYAFGAVRMDVLSSDIFIKMSDDIPSVDEWKDITQYGQSLDNYTFTEGEGYYIITEDYGGGDTVDIIIVVSDENGASIPNIGNAQSEGIYVASSVYTGKSYNKEDWAFQNWDLDSITYEGTTTVVHQIPAKYIPSTGLDVFEIKVSQDIFYGEPLEVENVTYQDIMDACSAGKYIVLTIMADDDIGVQGRCLGGNFSRMENTGGSIYGQPCYCFAGAYRKESSGSSGQFGGYSLKDVVLYEDANDGLLYVELQNCNDNG